LICVDDVNILDETYIRKKNTEVLLDNSKENGAEVKAQKTKHMFTTRHQDEEQNRNINTVINPYIIW
jgi:hypothetical protein